MSSEISENDKQKIIAEAAFAVFAAHGFRRTSMEKIAAEAGMSRPALYLHFDSKEDVFAHLTIRFFEDVRAQTQQVLTQVGHPAAVLQAMFDAWNPGGVMEILLDAEHGHELMELKTSLAADKIAAIEAQILADVTAWLTCEARAGRIHCAVPALTAQTIQSAYYGLKNPIPDYATYKARVADLAQMLGNGLHLPK